MSVHNDDYRNRRLAYSVRAEGMLLSHAAGPARTHAQMP